jgi:hypothetical protein
MLNFVYHPTYLKHIAALERRFPQVKQGVEAFKRLCDFQFDPVQPRQVIAPAKLHRRKQLEACGIWKIELAVAGVRSNQSPRIWFAVQGATIVFLCAASHIDNYDDNKMEALAESLVTDIFS